MMMDRETLSIDLTFYCLEVGSKQYTFFVSKARKGDVGMTAAVELHTCYTVLSHYVDT